MKEGDFTWNSVIGVLVFVVAVCWLLGDFKKDTWIPEFYPYGPDNLLINTEGPIGSSLEECRSWVALQAIKDADGVYDYECGKNCRSEGELLICEETVE